MELLIALFLFIWLGFLKIDHDTTKSVGDRRAQNRAKILEYLKFPFEEELEIQKYFENNQPECIRFIKDDVEYIFGDHAYHILQVADYTHTPMEFTNGDILYLAYQIYLAKKYGKIPCFLLDYSQRMLPYYQFGSLTSAECDDIVSRFCLVIEKYVQEKHKDLDLYMYDKRHGELHTSTIVWNFDVSERILRECPGRLSDHYPS